MTPPTDRPDRRVTDTRQRLIDTTLELIDAHGRQEVTLTGVARACGVTTPACYKHFPSKTSLFNAAVRQLSSNLGEQAEQQLQDDPVESLLAIGMILINLAADHPTSSSSTSSAPRPSPPWTTRSRSTPCWPPPATRSSAWPHAKGRTPSASSSSSGPAFRATPDSSPSAPPVPTPTSYAPHCTPSSR